MCHWPKCEHDLDKIVKKYLKFIKLIWNEGEKKFNQDLAYLRSKKYKITSKNPTYQRFLNNIRSSPQFLKKYCVNLEIK